MQIQKIKNLHPFDSITLVQFSLGIFIFVGYLTSIRLFSVPRYSPPQLLPSQTSEIKPLIGNGQANFVVGETSELAFQLNTDNKPIMGAQLVYTVESDVLPSLTTDQIIIPEESGFVPLYIDVSPIAGGYEVKIAVRPAGDFSADLTYSNSSFVNIAKMKVTPSGPGAINIRFNPALSTVLNTDIAQALKPMADFSVPIQ